MQPVTHEHQLLVAEDIPDYADNETLMCTIQWGIFFNILKADDFLL